MKRAALIMLVASICVGVLALSGSAGASTVPVPDSPIPGSTDFYLKECSKLPEARKRTCYIRKLLAEVERTKRPGARASRASTRDVHGTGGYLESNCHMFMHAVGRSWARRHGVKPPALGRHRRLVDRIAARLAISAPRSALPLGTALEPDDDQASLGREDVEVPGRGTSPR